MQHNSCAEEEEGEAYRIRFLLFKSLNFKTAVSTIR